MSLGIRELQEVRRASRELLKRELLPHVPRLDDAEEFPRPAFDALAKASLHLLHLPEEWGGADSLRGMVLVAEEMGRIDPGFALSVLASSQLFGYNVARLGTPEQKKKYLPPLLAGCIGCWALTEPDVGSDAVGIKTRARKQGEDYILDGSKTFITNAPIADYFIVLARESGEGIEGGTAFILERGQPGLELGRSLKKMGHRTSPTGELSFHNCKVSKHQVLGQPGKAFFDMKHSLDLERVIFFGIALGMMKEASDRAIRYASTREQFGQPIAQFQLVQEKIAGMVARTEFVECYLEKTLSRIESGEPVNLEAAVLKYLGAQMCEEVTHAAVQVLGGNGYMREYFVEKLYRDARLFSIGGGTSEMNCLVIAKQAMKRKNA